MARKTVSVDFIKEKVNYFLENSADDRSDARLADAGLLESVLQETDNYRGFRYLASEYFENDPSNGRDEYAPLLRKGYDNTRRHYH